MQGLIKWKGLLARCGDVSQLREVFRVMLKIDGAQRTLYPSVVECFEKAGKMGGVRAAQELYNAYVAHHVGDDAAGAAEPEATRGQGVDESVAGNDSGTTGGSDASTSGAGDAAGVGAGAAAVNASNPLAVPAVLRRGLVKAMCAAGDVETAVALISQLQVPMPSPASWAPLMANAARVGKLELALKVFAAMRDAGVRPDTASFNVLLKACGQRDATEAVRIFESMRAEGAEPNVMSFDLVMRAEAASGDMEAVVARLVEMKASGHELTVSQFNHVLSACARARAPADALAVMEEMRGLGVEPDGESFSHLIVAYALVSNARGVLDTFHQAFTERQPPQGRSYSIALDACLELNALESGRRVLGYAEKLREESAASDVKLARSMASMYARLGEEEKTEAALRAFLREHPDVAGPSDMALLVDARGQRRGYQSAKELSKELKTDAFAKRWQVAKLGGHKFEKACSAALLGTAAYAPKRRSGEQRLSFGKVFDLAREHHERFDDTHHRLINVLTSAALGRGMVDVAKRIHLCAAGRTELLGDRPVGDEAAGDRGGEEESNAPKAEEDDQRLEQFIDTITRKGSKPASTANLLLVYRAAQQANDQAWLDVVIEQLKATVGLPLLLSVALFVPASLPRCSLARAWSSADPFAKLTPPPFADALRAADSASSWGRLFSGSCRGGRTGLCD